jgi:hypothetical protein
MKNLRLPPELEALVVGSVLITTDGPNTKRRVYVCGDHPELAMYGTHVRLLSGEETQTHGPETVVDIEIGPLPSEYYLG